MRFRKKVGEEEMRLVETERHRTGKEYGVGTEGEEA
jgi:hypothetical protein